MRPGNNVPPKNHWTGPQGGLKLVNNRTAAFQFFMNRLRSTNQTGTVGDPTNAPVDIAERERAIISTCVPGVAY
jgi:hypothetical protein